MKIKIQINGGDIVEVEGVKVMVEGIGPYEDEQLHTNFTSEGIIHDAIGVDGDVHGTDSAEYDDVLHCVQNSQFC